MVACRSKPQTMSGWINVFENVHEFDRIYWPITSRDVYFFGNAWDGRQSESSFGAYILYYRTPARLYRDERLLSHRRVVDLLAPQTIIGPLSVLERFLSGHERNLSSDGTAVLEMHANAMMQTKIAPRTPGLERSLENHVLHNGIERVDSVSCTDIRNQKWNQTNWLIISKLTSAGLNERVWNTIPILSRVQFSLATPWQRVWSVERKYSQSVHKPRGRVRLSLQACRTAQTLRASCLGFCVLLRRTWVWCVCSKVFSSLPFPFFLLGEDWAF